MKYILSLSHQTLRGALLLPGPGGAITPWLYRSRSAVASPANQQKPRLRMEMIKFYIAVSCGNVVNEEAAAAATCEASQRVCLQKKVWMELNS